MPFLALVLIRARTLILKHDILAMPKGPGYSGLRLRSGTVVAGFRLYSFQALESPPPQYKPLLSLSRASIEDKSLWYCKIASENNMLYKWIDQF